MKIAIFTIVSLSLLSVRAAASTEPLEADVSTERAYIWNEPGYTWKDCRPMDPRSTYRSDEEKAMTQACFDGGAGGVCRSRVTATDLLESGDTVEILLQKNKPITIAKQIFGIGAVLVEKKFYKVKSAKGKIGWMSEDQLTEPRKREVLKAASPKKKKDEACDPKTKNSPGVNPKYSQELLENVDKDMPFAGAKTDAEIDRYMCLYRDRRISDAEFLSKFQDYQRAARDAAVAFKMPYSLIMCTMLVESALYNNPAQRSEYRGLGQFGSSMVEDLNNKIQRPPYATMWSSFQKANPSVGFSDDSIRMSSDPRAPAAAIGLAMSWIYNERFTSRDVKCPDCTRNQNFNRKDLYMMITAYNWGPYSLKKVANLTPAQMLAKYPPPKETRDYMLRLENCLAKGHEKNFREDNYDIERINQRRQQRIRAIQQAQQKQRRKDKTADSEIERLNKMITLGASDAYEARIGFCDQKFGK